MIKFQIIAASLCFHTNWLNKFKAAHTNSSSSSTHPWCLPSLSPSSSAPASGWSACAAGRRSGWSWRGGCLCRPSPVRCRSPARCEPDNESSRAGRSSSLGKSSPPSQSASAGASPERSSSSQRPRLYPWEAQRGLSHSLITTSNTQLACSLTSGSSEQQWGPSSYELEFLHTHGCSVYFPWDEPGRHKHTWVSMIRFLIIAKAHFCKPSVQTPEM